MVSKTVGIVANPVSARDIRRVIAHAGSLQITDRANIVLRIMSGLAAAGVERVVMMPERGGIRTHLMRAMERQTPGAKSRLPELSFLDMTVTSTARDSAVAAAMMRDQDVGAIVILGGDGTHRVVLSESGNVPIAGVSSGTNNAYPQMREPTVVGLAVGLAVTNQVPTEQAYNFNKRLDVICNERCEMAIVDVAVVADQYVGARAIWRTESFRELFVAFAQADGIGMSAIPGQICPVSRDEPVGRRLRLLPLDEARHHLTVSIAPGLIETIGFNDTQLLYPDVPVSLAVSQGSIALDGEREFSFSADDDVAIILRTEAFRSVDVEQCMAYAAKHGLFVSTNPRITPSTIRSGDLNEHKSISTRA